MPAPESANPYQTAIIEIRAIDKEAGWGLVSNCREIPCIHPSTYVVPAIPWPNFNDSHSALSDVSPAQSYRFAGLAACSHLHQKKEQLRRVWLPGGIPVRYDLYCRPSEKTLTIEERSTRRELGLEPNCRWLAYWSQQMQGPQLFVELLCNISHSFNLVDPENGAGLE